MRCDGRLVVCALRSFRYNETTRRAALFGSERVSLSSGPPLVAGDAVTPISSDSCLVEFAALRTEYVRQKKRSSRTHYSRRATRSIWNVPLAESRAYGPRAINRGQATNLPDCIRTCLTHTLVNVHLPVAWLDCVVWYTARAPAVSDNLRSTRERETNAIIYYTESRSASTD